MMQEERDTGAYEMPNLHALDAELDRRIEAVLERKLQDRAFLSKLLERLLFQAHVQAGAERRDE